VNTGLALCLKIHSCPSAVEPNQFWSTRFRVCERAGVRLKEGWPPDVDFGAVLDCYYFHLGAFDYSMTRPEFQVHTRDHLDTKPRTWNVGP
jgi:hypothetical protein